MFCETCGFEIEETDQYCRKCGKVIGGGARVEAPRACARVRKQRMVAGVCGGCADYFRQDVTLVRIVWVLAALSPPLFPGIAAYVVCWLLMPVSGEGASDKRQPAGEAVASK